MTDRSETREQMEEPQPATIRQCSRCGFELRPDEETCTDPGAPGAGSVGHCGGKAIEVPNTPEGLRRLEVEILREELAVAFSLLNRARPFARPAWLEDLERFETRNRNTKPIGTRENAAEALRRRFLVPPDVAAQADRRVWTAERASATASAMLQEFREGLRDLVAPLAEFAALEQPPARVVREVVVETYGPRERWSDEPRFNLYRASIFVDGVAVLPVSGYVDRDEANRAAGMVSAATGFPCKLAED